ncbi:hypothetical protein [Methanobrevibacter sp.]|uniref:hypothetical protein n=1 Tax=Methanobrevibacter sp. TaxID=66852 RepID=UPI00386C3C37
MGAVKHEKNNIHTIRFNNYIHRHCKCICKRQWNNDRCFNQTIDQQHISVDTNQTNENYLNDVSVQADNNTLTNNENSTINVKNVTADDAKTVEKTAKLNITGPKKGNDIKINRSKITFQRSENRIYQNGKRHISFC